MPIILDQNSTNDVSQQMKSVSKKLQTSKSASAKWFNEALTGSNTRKTGFFNTESHTLGQVAKDAMNKIGHSSEITKQLVKLIDDELIEVYSESKGKESYFTPFARAITGFILPTSFSAYQPDDTPNRIGDPWDVISHTDEDIIFPQNSPLFNVMNMNSWTELTHTNGVLTVVHPIVQSYQLSSALIKSATASGNQNKFSTTGSPVIYLAVASIADNVAIDANVHVGGNKLAPSQDDIPMSLIPVDMSTTSRYLMTSYTGVQWNTVMENITDHYTRAGLDNLDTSKHGVLDVDSELMDMLNIIKDLSIVDALDSQAQTSVNQPEDIIMTAIDALLDYHSRTRNTGSDKLVGDHVVRSLKLTVQIMDHLSYKDDTLISTDFLNNIYQKLKSSSLSNQETNFVIQESLRLLLSQRLHELQAVHQSGGLYKFDPQDDAVTKQYMNDPSYSNQQKRIVTTTEPLVIGQAGAGSGKSHTLIGRIKYLQEQGEDLKKALVLSFTNISAININQRFPEIRSETLANMFNQIYQNTYPAQQLSQPSTVANSLQLLNPNTKYFTNKGFTPDEVGSYIRKFSATLSMLDQTGFKRVNVQEVTKDLANLIQHNMELTEILLNAVEQTTLELQPIIIHHHLMNNHGQLNVPKEYQDLDYIITDESQDISTFEYILLLELAIHHSAQLLIVGDGSQTLYEFRNSDPKYMNALESSGVFTTYKLDVNFRSSPEVLTFANQFLDIIEANDVAKIQLRASSFKKPSVKSFEDAITVHNVETSSSKPADYHDGLRRIVKDDKNFDKWFRNIMDNDEQVAILGWTRKEVLEVGEELEAWLDKNGYDVEVTNIMNDRSRPMTVISNTLANIRHDVLRLDPANSNFKSKLEQLASNYIDRKYHYSSDAQKGFFLGEFKRAVDSTMMKHQWNILVQDYQNGNLAKESVIGHLNRELLRIETRKNAMDAHLLRAEEAPDYSSKKIILSTIHGAKGLEFDHTLVLFNESKRGSTSQESLRMLFVALSRARQSEYILNGHKTRHHGVSDTLSAMFDTPMQTGFMRAVNELSAPSTP